MLHFEGDKDFSRPPQEVWDRLTDARFLVRCIPDVDSVKETTADRAVLILRPGFAFVRGTLEVTLQIAEKTASSSAKVVLHSKGIGSSSTVEAVLSLAPHGETATHVHWVAEVTELGGLLKLVPSGLIRGAAQKVIADAWTAAEAKMSEAPSQT
jgi:carbon monoxide dehydrogenase subunit G